jgi:hypothetical protein
MECSCMLHVYEYTLWFFFQYRIIILGTVFQNIIIIFGKTTIFSHSLHYRILADLFVPLWIRPSCSHFLEFRNCVFILHSKVFRRIYKYNSIPGEPGLCMHVPQWQVTQLYPQALGRLFMAYDSQGYSGGIVKCLHTGHCKIFVSRLSGKCGVLYVSHSFRPPRPVTRIVLLFFLLPNVFHFKTYHVFNGQ